MATDSTTMSSAARKIFDQIKSYFPSDPWDKLRWSDDGKVYDGRWYDLCLSADRRLLMKAQKETLGYLVEMKATHYRTEHGSLDGFTGQHYTSHMQQVAELLLLLNDLDFQMETMDIVEG